MNITTVTIQGCHSQVRYTSALYQYDYGQVLKIEGVELPETFQAHFCNVSDTSTKTVLGSDNQVSIPDEYLDTGEDILCYIYLHTGEDDGETEYKIFIPVTARQSITNEEPTPEQQSEIDQLIIALNDGVSRAETAATNAEASETNAKTSEDNAKESELNAKASEDAVEAFTERAEQAATSAEASASSASQSATNASASATLAESWAVGGTGTRQGEDTNNAKYYAESTIAAKDAAVMAKTQAESARDLAVQAKDSAQASAQTASTKASEATQSAANASQSASSASASATSALQSATSADSAKTAAQTAQGLAEDARDEAVTAKDEAETAQQEAEAAAQSIAQSAQQIETNTQDISDLKSAIQTKAEIDGNYKDLTAGSADQLVSTQYHEDQEPYLFRTSGGSADIGDLENDVIVGGSVVWNQYCGETASFTDWTETRASVAKEGNITTVTSVSSSTTTLKYIRKVFPQNHNLYVRMRNIVVTKATTGLAYYGVYSGTAGSNYMLRQMIGEGYVSDVDTIITTGSSFTNPAFTIGFSTANQIGDKIDIEDLQLIDLTVMFGTAIADYVYSLEQTTEGSGIAWLKKYGFFTDDYYEYSEPTIRSVKGLVSHDMVGFNAYDHSTAKAKVVGGQRYQITGAYTALTMDGEAVTPDASGFFTPVQSGELSVTGGNDSTTCIHLVWSGTRNGEYEPYEKASYPLDSSLTLRGIPKLDSQNQMYYDGDRYEPDGTVMRRYGMVDLGTLSWTPRTSGEQNALYSSSLPQEYVPSSSLLCGWICDTYAENSPSSAAILQQNVDSKAIGLYSYRSTGAKSTTFYLITPKTASPQGTLVYELATPTTETAEPFVDPQRVNDWGTEEYVCPSESDFIVPVGHDTKYLVNLRDKLQHLPNLADNDGYYLIQQSGTQMSLVNFRIPQAPSTDGSYILKATVSGGVPTYTWEAVVESTATEVTE